MSLQGEKVHKREKWTRKIDFLFACIGFSVGLGNIWRFPYLCYKNGGGAFLIPYFICVFFAAIPMFFLEASLGQFMGAGGLKCWNICPLLQGIGVATTIIVALLNIYYNVILCWAFYYLFASFTSRLPWTHCDNSWNTPNCSSFRNDTNTTVNASKVSIDPVTEFWERKVLNISSGINEPGEVKWDLALCLLLAWIVVYLCICKGIKSSGKVMYITAPAPYLFMLILLIRGATLPGSLEGVKFYVVPDWSRLSDIKVWVDAGTQIFFSYSISLGTLTALGSYNDFHHNVLRDSLLFALTNSGTSFFGGFVIFSVLGYMSFTHGTPISKVAESGPGLAFIAYPKAIGEMPGSVVWSIFFFIMLILLGLDSQFVGVEGFVTAVVDQYPKILRIGKRKEIFIAVVCAISYLIGLSMVTRGGMYVFQLFDYYSGSRIVVLVAVFECIAVAHVYGVDRYWMNIEYMLGRKTQPLMKWFWFIVTPLCNLIIFVLACVTYSELTYNDTYVYPKWAIAIGWSLAAMSVIMIPIVAIAKLIMAKGTLIERFKELKKPILQDHQKKLLDFTGENDQGYKENTV